MSGLPAEQGGSQSSGPFGPEVCAFVFKLNPGGDALGFSTYLCNNSMGAGDRSRPRREHRCLCRRRTQRQRQHVPIVGGLPPDQGGGAFGGTEGFVAKLDESAPLLSLRLARYQIDETGGSVSVEIERVGTLSTAVSVEFATSDGTATAPADYTSTSGTLSWGPSDGEAKTIPHPDQRGQRCRRRRSLHGRS